jgi:hypothetical protein
MDWLDRAIAVLGSAHEREPQNTVTAEYLRSALARRANGRTLLGSAEKALADWDAALALGSRGSVQLPLQLGRAATMARAGRHARAAAAVEDVAGPAGADAKVLLAGAKILALCGSGAEADPTLAPRQRDELADRYETQAADWLRRSSRADPASGPGLLAEIRREAAFDPLHRRADFQALIDDLSFPNDAFGR